MDIDSTIEDLEAQAYFASQITRSCDKFSLVIDVELLKPEHQTKRLSMALIGLDFVAGFLDSHLQPSNTWIFIPNHSISSVTLKQGLLEESLVELSASAFIESRLRGASISIKQARRVKPNQGKLVKTLGNQLVLKVSTLQLIPLESIEWLAVDSFSTANSK
jgi:hypothetical protein